MTKKRHLQIVENNTEPPKKNAQGSLVVPTFINEEEDDSGSTGTGGSGTGKPLIDPALFGLTNHVLLEQIRKGEALFGHVPFTEDPTKKNRAEGQLGKGMPSHPLFRDTQQFSGISDNKNNPSPSENSEAAGRMEAELQNRLQLAARPQNRNAIPPPTPTLTR